MGAKKLLKILMRRYCCNANLYKIAFSNRCMKSSTIFIVGFAVILVLVILAVELSTSSGPTIYDDFAQCLSDSGAKMYGVYWCSHCKEQKEKFDNSKYIPYIECDPRGDNANPSACEAAGVDGYPTWVFGNGEKVSGTRTLTELALKSGCGLPE